jgi:hypothetical protein
MHMNEQELDAIVDAKLAEQLAARLAADRARVRDEVIRELRREAERAHHARINARHPIESKLAGLTPEQEAQRQANMGLAPSRADRRPWPCRIAASEARRRAVCRTLACRW